MRRAWWIPVAGAVLAPLVTFWPMVAYRYPWTGLPQYPAAAGINFWSSQTFWLIALGLVAWLVGREDRYLGWAVALAALTVFWRGARLDPTHSVLFAFGAVIVLVMRRAPAISHRRIASVLVGIGVFELLYICQQIFLQYDVLWGPLFGGKLTALIQPLGTIGTVDGAAAFVAVLAPLMPWWLLPVVGVAIWKGHSVSATLALAAGLGVRYRHHRWIAVPLLAGVGVMAWQSAFAKSLNPLIQHLTGRGAIWGFALGDWLRSDPLVGYGLGGWSQRIPLLQVQAQFLPAGELWREAHNEPLQWLCEAGVIGLVLLAMWLWTHRTMFQHPVWGPSLSALGVNSVFFFPMHVVQISLVGLILVGLATAPVRQDVAESPVAEWGAET